MSLLLVRCRRAFALCKTSPSDFDTVSQTTAYEVHLTQAGSIANITIRLQQMLTWSLALHEAIVDVQAVGLNFRDVLNVLGLDPTGAVRPIGGEAAGMVSSVGRAGGPALPSEHAYGLIPGSLRSRAWCDARYVRCMRFDQTTALEGDLVLEKCSSMLRFMHRAAECRRLLPSTKPSRCLSCGSRRATALLMHSFGRCRVCLSMPLRAVSASSLWSGS